MSFLKTENDDLDFPGGSSSKLANLFGNSSDLGNESLTYTAPKQPKKESVKQSENSQGGGSLACLHANPVTAFKLVNGQYESQGKVGAAVLGNHENNIYNMILYKGKQQPIAMVSLSDSFRFTVQPNNYANFYDNQKQNWSVLFDTCEACCNFAKNVALAMANSAGTNQLKKLIVQDLILGDGNELAVDDSAEIKYTGWFLSNYTFGKVFDSNKNSDKQFRVRLGKGKVIKGWEEGLIGAKKNSRRILVIPPNFGYGAQGMGERIPPNSILIFEIDVNKVKTGKERSDSNSRSATPQLSDYDSTLDVKNDAKPNIATKPRTHSVKSVDNIRVRGESITEQLSTGPNVNKAKLISRMAKMGQPMIPLEGAVPVQPSDESDEEPEETERPLPNSTSQPSPQKEPPPRKEPSHTKKASAEVYDRPVHSHTKPAVKHLERQDVAANDVSHQQLSVYPHQNPYAQHPGMMVGGTMGYPTTPFQQPTVLPPQYLPVQQVQPPAANPVNDGHSALLLSETRNQNIEVRLNISKLCDKIDLVMSAVNEMKANATSSIVPSVGFSAMEPTILLHSITKMVQENTLLKNELEEKRSKLESQSEKISELLHRNQRFIEQSNDMFGRKNDSLQSTALESQARMFTLEKEKSALSFQLSDALSKLSAVQQHLASKQNTEAELMSKLDSSSSSSLKNTQVLSEMKSKVSDAENTILDLQKSLRSEKQENIENVKKLSTLEGTVVDFRNKNSSLEKSLADGKQKIVEQLKEFETQIALLKASHLEDMKNVQTSSVPKSNELRELEETLNSKWQTRCDKLLSEAEIRHKQQTKDDQKELIMKVRDLKQKLQESASNLGQDEKLKNMQSEIESLSEWKPKYENLYSNVVKMKQRYEDTIEEMQNNQSENSLDTVTGVKKVMNAVYKQLQELVDKEDSYTGTELLETVLGVIRETTIKYLQKDRQHFKQEKSVKPDENDSERGIDEVDEQISSDQSSELNVPAEKNVRKESTSDQEESCSHTAEFEDISSNSHHLKSADGRNVIISESVNESGLLAVNKSPDACRSVLDIKTNEKEELDEVKFENDSKISGNSPIVLCQSQDRKVKQVESSEENSEHSDSINKESGKNNNVVGAKTKNLDVKDPIILKSTPNLDQDFKPVPPPLGSDDDEDDNDPWLC